MGYLFSKIFSKIKKNNFVRYLNAIIFSYACAFIRQIMSLTISASYITLAWFKQMRVFH